MLSSRSAASAAAEAEGVDKTDTVKTTTVILATLLILVAVTPVAAAQFSYDDYYTDPYDSYHSALDDPLLCTAIEMWGCLDDTPIYGEIYTHNVFSVQTELSAAWENMTGIMEPGNFSTFEQGSPDDWTIKITKNGTYKVSYSVSFMGTANSEYDFGISVNGADPENKTHSHRTTSAGGAFGVTASSAILQLTDSDKIMMMARDEATPNKNITVKHANFNIEELFGIDGTQTIIINQTVSGGGGAGVDSWVNTTGDTMTGALNMSNQLWLYPNGSINMGGNFSVFGGNVIIWSNGTVEIGPVGGGGAGIDAWVNTTGDTMTGALNMSNQLWLYPNGSINMGGNFSVFGGAVVIWSNGTVEAGATPVVPIWVNKTGDVMSGDLNISAAASITETLIVGDHVAIGSEGNIFVIRVLDVAENINIDSSFNGIVSVLRQKVNLSPGRETLAFNYETVCDTNVTCQGSMAGYRGNTRNRGSLTNARGGFVTVFNERRHHNITSAVGLFAVISTRLDNEMGTISTAEAVRAAFSMENGTIRDAIGFSIRNPSSLTNNGRGRIWNLTGFKSGDLMSNRLNESHAFDFGDDLNGSDIRGNFTGHQLLNQTFLMVPEWLKVVPSLYVYKNGTINTNANISVRSGNIVIWSNGTIETGPAAGGSGIDFTDAFVNRTGDTMTDNLTMIGKQTRIKGGMSFVETFPDVVTASEDAISVGSWGLGSGVPQQPDVPRTINVTFQSFDPGGCTGFLYINGTDAFGIYITELITVSVPGFAVVEYETDHAYGNITAIVEDTPLGVCAYPIGTTWRFGMANYPFNSAVDVYKVNADGAHIGPAGYEVIPLFGTVNLEITSPTFLGETVSMIFWYRNLVNS